MIKINQELQEIIDDLTEAGGKPYLVGGSVRDAVMGVNNVKDYDIEVFGLNHSAIVDAVSGPGRKVSTVGEGFGVVLVCCENNDYDISIPRRENKIGAGHKGFSVVFNPNMTIREAAARRDFTINALTYDPVSREIIDPFGGRADIERGILRHVSPAFAEDPLRVLRGMQFAGRFDMRAHPTTAALCMNLRDTYANLPVERVAIEWEKWAMKSIRPSAGLEFLRNTGWVELYPSLNNLIDCPQDSEWHPEGCVWTHTLHCLDAAREIADREALSHDPRVESGKKRRLLMFATLCHDLGKPATTEFKRNSQNEIGSERWRAHGHPSAGADIAEEFVMSIGGAAWIDLARRASNLTKEHLVHINKINRRSVRRLSVRLGDASIQDLVWLIEADKSGRPPLPKGVPDSALRLLELAKEESVQAAKPGKILMGRDLISAGVMQPGPAMGRVLKAAYEAQLDGEFTNKGDALEWARRHLDDSSQA